MNWRGRITIKPEVCHDKPCIKGTRVMVGVVIANVAAGESFESITSGYHISREDIQATLYFPVDLAQDRYVAFSEIDSAALTKSIGRSKKEANP
jgi:uncharacterized protein (DUF433 family)